MSNGFIAYNNANEVLISSETRNLHFIGKASSPSVTNSSGSYGGFVELTYTIYCPVTPVPFFTLPTGDYYGIAGIKPTGGNWWNIVVIRSGTSASYPEVYVFADPRAAASNSTFGMVVYRNDGTPAFDSRLRPLAVSGGTAVSHTSNPRISIPGLSDWQCSSGSDTGAFTPDTENGPYGVGSMPAKPMFHYSSLAQAERQASWSGYDEDCDGISYGVCIGFSRTDEWTSTYWAFYRGGVRRSGNDVYAGWITVRGGCWWQSWSDSDFFIIDTGGGGGSGGQSPYSNETINLYSSAVIVGDASRYD